MHYIGWGKSGTEDTQTCSSYPEAHNSLKRVRVMCSQKENEREGERKCGRMEGSVLTMLPWFDFCFRRCDSFDAYFLCCHVMHLSDMSDTFSGTKNPGSSKENKCFFILFYFLPNGVFFVCVFNAYRLKISCCMTVATMSCVTLEVPLTNSRTLRQKGWMR